MTKFIVNVYDVYPIDRSETVTIDDMTEQHQAQSVREILTKFATQGVTTQQESMSSKFAGEFPDDIPINDPRIDTLLDSPDLTHMDEMDMADFITSHTLEINRSDLNKSPSIESPASTQNPSPSTQDPLSAEKTGNE